MVDMVSFVTRLASSSSFGSDPTSGRNHNTPTSTYKPCGSEHRNVLALRTPDRDVPCYAGNKTPSFGKAIGFFITPIGPMLAERIRTSASQITFNYRPMELTMNTDNIVAGKSDDATDVLAQDHKKVKELFKDFSQLEGTSPVAARIALVQAICTELTIHAAIEEELFYPAARKATNDDDLVNEAEIEHATVKYLIKQLLPLKEDDAYLKAKVTVLREYTRHHINEEENEMFPKIKQAKLDLSALGQQLMDRKKALQEQLKTPEQLIAFTSADS
jgi:hemerythrin superfamily protein